MSWQMAATKLEKSEARMNYAAVWGGRPGRERTPTNWFFF
jgi:hypothetical protein